jgi:hypothetical protein|tara:strand:- start:3704 stop:3883 length:180 start_codon:yes stop_codon:yes gene_type:complete
MAKTWNNRGKSNKRGHSQKKREYQQLEDLRDQGLLREISNQKRIQIDKDLDFKDTIFDD